MSTTYQTDFTFLTNVTLSQVMEVMAQNHGVNMVKRFKKDTQLKLVD